MVWQYLLLTSTYLLVYFLLYGLFFSLKLYLEFLKGSIPNKSAKPKSDLLHKNTPIFTM